MKYYINPETEKGINQLHELVKPFLYRVLVNRIYTAWDELGVAVGRVAVAALITAEAEQQFYDAWNEAV